MSEELPAGAMSLEEPTVVGAISDPDTAAPAEDEAVPEGTIEGSGGVKFVPLSAVIAERTKGKESKAEAARLAMAEALPKAGSVLLEPVHAVEIAVPTDAMSKASGMISALRSRSGGTTIVKPPMR